MKNNLPKKKSLFKTSQTWSQNENYKLTRSLRKDLELSKRNNNSLRLSILKTKHWKMNLKKFEQYWDSRNQSSWNCTPRISRTHSPLKKKSPSANPQLAITEQTPSHHWHQIALQITLINLVNMVQPICKIKLDNPSKKVHSNTTD